MKWTSALRLEEFLSHTPSMRLTEYCPERVTIEGTYRLYAQMAGCEPIRDDFELKIVFSSDYPQALPVVFETGGRLPRNQDHHTYPDGSLCLGSEIKLKAILKDKPTVCYLVSRVIDPFLYSVSYKLKHQVFPYGELAHGEDGLVQDYETLFQVSGKRAVLLTLEALAARKRVANKMACPCGCGLRLGRCDFRYSLAEWRELDRRRWFREHMGRFSAIEKPKGKRKKRKARRN